MIKIENVVLPSGEQMDAIIRGMRNPMNSWEKSDSYSAVDCGKCGKIEREGCCKKEDRDCTGFECYVLGDNDLSLMKKLSKAGPTHRKFMRMMPVYLDITAPLYWWKEFDTNKVGTVANSTSTMHKIQAKEFELDDFSTEHLDTCCKGVLQNTIDSLNTYRKDYVRTKDKRSWWQMIQLLPSSYNQKRTVMLNYEVLAAIYPLRKDHKLDEWREFCKWIESLPMSELITRKEK